MKLLNLIVKPFINNENGIYTGAYTSNLNSIFIHNEETVIKKGNSIFIQLKGNAMLTADLLNCFPNVKAEIKGGLFFINGYQWDGKKTDLNLFID